MRSVRQQIGGVGNLMFKEAYIIGQVLDGKIPDKYLQSTKYWEKHADIIRATFGQGINKSDYVSLHIRRGDYTNNPFYVDLTQTDYYDKALAKFPNETFLIFCADNQGEEKDILDREWCYEWAESKGIKYIIHKPGTETDDLNDMAGCKAHVMANSSFSWWAAFLGGGTTIAPKEWFTDGVQRIDLLDNWIQL